MNIERAYILWDRFPAKRQPKAEKKTIEHGEVGFTINTLYKMCGANKPYGWEI